MKSLRRGRQKNEHRASVTTDELSSFKNPIVDPTCAICQVDVGKTSPDGVKESWALTPCGHAFGNVCLKRYLALSVLDKPSCPVCREDIFHECSHPILPVAYIIPTSSKRFSRSSAKAEDQILQNINRAWDGDEDPRQIPCRYCIANAPIVDAMNMAYHQDGDEDAEPMAYTAHSTIRRHRWKMAFILPVAIVFILFRGGGRRLLRRRRRGCDQDSATTTTTTTLDEHDPVDGASDGATLTGPLPPVPGYYGHWELVNNEPDWDYMKWFDAQEPKSKTSREDWAR